MSSATDKQTFEQQMKTAGLTHEQQIQAAMKTIPGVFYAGKGGYAIEHDGTFIPLPNESQVKQHLALAGVKKNLMTEVICRIRTGNYVGYIGPVAGHKPGLHHSVDSGQSFLVTHGPRILQAESGATPFIDRLLAGFIGLGDQAEGLKAWWRQGRRNVLAGERRPLPAVVLIGPPDSGKTLILEISRILFGGRSGSAFQYLAGKTQFNGDIIGAELTTVDDEIAHHDYKARTAFAQAIKRDHFASAVRLRKMYAEALLLRPVQALAIAVNNEAEHLQVLPTMDNSMRDKLSLFWCGKADLGGLSDRKEIWRRIESELPALCYLLDSTDHPNHFQHPRTGCAAWQSMEALEALQAISPEERLAELLGQCYTVRVTIEGCEADLCCKKREPSKDGWQGSSAELEHRLTEDEVTRRGAEKLFRWDGACGSILGKLERSGRIDISSSTVRGTRIWKIKSLQPIEGVKEDSGGAYSVRGWSGGPRSGFLKQEGGEEKNKEKNTLSKSTTPPRSSKDSDTGKEKSPPPKKISVAVEVPPPESVKVTAKVVAQPPKLISVSTTTCSKLVDPYSTNENWRRAMHSLEDIQFIPECLKNPAKIEDYGDRLFVYFNEPYPAERLGKDSQAVQVVWKWRTGRDAEVTFVNPAAQSFTNSPASNAEDFENNPGIEASVDRLEATLNTAN